MPWPIFNWNSSGSPLPTFVGWGGSTSTNVPLPPPIQSALTPNYVAARASGQNPAQAALTATGEGLASGIKSARSLVDNVKSNLWLILLLVAVIGYSLLKRK
jgi:hypothetical protein